MFAVNEHGNGVSSSISIRKGTPPGMPTNFEVVSATDVSIKLCWSVPDAENDLQVDEYEIQVT